MYASPGQYSGLLGHTDLGNLSHIRDGAIARERKSSKDPEHKMAPEIICRRDGKIPVHEMRVVLTAP